MDVLLHEFLIRHALIDSARTDAGLRDLADSVGVQLNSELARWPQKEITLELLGRTGDDNRREMEEIRDETIQENGQSVCAIIKARNLRFNDSDGKWVIDKYRNLAETRSLCPAENRFHVQPLAAYGTAFVVRDSVIATAAHTIRSCSWDVDSFLVVFDFETEGGVANRVFDTSQVFRAVEIVACRLDKNTDWALLRLDRSPGRTPLLLNCSGAPECGDSLYMIGHGEGLPLKYSDGAAVTAWSSRRRYFNASVDAFYHDSGAPVFNSGTHKVEGLLWLTSDRYVDIDGGTCNDSSECCVPVRLEDDPACHATIVPASEFSHWVAPDGCPEEPPPSVECPRSYYGKEPSSVITVEARFAIFRVECGLPRLLTPNTQLEPVPLPHGSGTVFLYNCDENGCRWEPHSVVAGRHYKIEDMPPHDVVPGRKRVLKVVLTEVQ